MEIWVDLMATVLCVIAVTGLVAGALILIASSQ